MRINGLNGANTPVGGMNMTKATDSVSKNIQNQIANAQKQFRNGSGTGAGQRCYKDGRQSRGAGV